MADANIGKLSEEYIASINSPSMTEEAKGRITEAMLKDALSEGRHPGKTAIGNLVFDIGANSGLLGEGVQAFRTSKWGRGLDFLFNMAVANQAGVAEDPYGDYVKNGSRYVPARPTGYAGDVAMRDAVDSAIGVAQYVPITAIPATLLSGKAHQGQHDYVRAKKSYDIAELQDLVRKIDPKSPQARNQLLHYAALLKGMSGTGEIARGTLGQPAYAEIKHNEDTRRQAASPLTQGFNAYMAPFMQQDARFAELKDSILKESDEIMKFEADLSKVGKSRKSITYPAKRFAAWASDWLSPDRLLETMSGNVQGSYFSDQNLNQYQARRRFMGDNRILPVAETPKDRRAEIAAEAEEAYPGIAPQQWFAEIKAENDAAEARRARWRARASEPEVSFPGL
jgi:hypothetical protein